MASLLRGALEILLAVQAPQAAVTGMVRNEETGDPLPGAVISLPDLGRATAADSGGRYLLAPVPAGPQHIAVRFIGYAPRTLHALVPPDGQLEINISLRSTPLWLPTLEVRPPVVVRGLDGDSIAFPDRASSMAAAWNHPLLAEPDVFQALGGGEVVLDPEAPSGIHIRGGASDQNAYLLDGIPILSPYHAAGVFSAWNPDALAGVHLASAAPSPAHPDALSGTIAGVTRAPSARLRALGSVSTTQTRLTLDGPIGAGAGYLVSVRSGFPDLVADHESSYLRGETGDWIAKIEAPALGGRLRLLGYGSGNELDVAALAEGETGWDSDTRRNAFEWRSRSLGAEWRRAFATVGVRLVGWSATGSASSVWAARAGRVDLAAARRDGGLLASLDHRAGRATTIAGLRVEWSRTSYRVESDSPAGPAARLAGETPVAAIFAEHVRPIHRRVDLNLAASLAAARRDLHLSPRAQLRWRPSERLTLSGSYARLHQFAQSLRNAESVVGHIFPADLHIGAGAPGIPVARSDQAVLAADYRPWAGVRLGLQAYERASDGLLLVAPRDGAPFTTGGFTIGSGTSRGLAVDAALSTARLGLMASYTLQHVRLAYGDSAYVPDHGATHLFEGGLTVFPTATFSIRLGVAGALGRRGTRVSGGFEWEACNLLDHGCEFSGSPHHDGQALGGTALPAYLRADLSVRKHWHVGVGGRDAVIALFGTVTNLFGRRNVLTYATDPATGESVAIEMRPRAPLVAGVEWRF